MLNCMQIQNHSKSYKGMNDIVLDAACVPHLASNPNLLRCSTPAKQKTRCRKRWLTSTVWENLVSNMLIDLAAYYIIPFKAFPNGPSLLPAENLKVTSWWTSEFEQIARFSEPLNHRQASSAQSSFLMTPHRCSPMPQCHHCHTSESKLADAWPWLQLWIGDSWCHAPSAVKQQNHC